MGKRKEHKSLHLLENYLENGKIEDIFLLKELFTFFTFETVKNKDEFKKYRFVGVLLIEKNKKTYNTLHGLDEIDQMMYQKMKNEEKHL